MDSQTLHLRLQTGGHGLDRGVGGHARADRYGTGGFVVGQIFVEEVHFAFELGEQRGDHPHAVLDLGVALVVVLGGEGKPCLEIQLVGAEEFSGAALSEALLREGLHLTDHGGGLLGGIGGQGVELVPILGQSRRHDGYAFHGVAQSVEIPHGAIQLLPIVDAAAEDDLTAQGDARLGQSGQIIQHQPRPLVVHHLHPQLGVGGMHRDVDRRDMHLNDAVDVLVAEVGHGDEVAVEEGQAAVVVLEVEGLPHPLGELVDEAEDALVLAGVLLVHQRGLEVQTDIVVLPLADGDLKGLAVAGQLQPDLGSREEEAVVQHVGNLAAIDGYEDVPRDDAVALGAAVGGDGGDLDHVGGSFPRGCLRYSAP